MDVKKNSPRAWLLAARPKTLTGAAVPVMIGLAQAWACDADGFSVVAALLCLLFAFVMQIDANLVNDLFDFLKGTDDRATRLGPERACAQGWVGVGAMRRAIVVCTLAACAVGLPLVIYGGWGMVAVGAACVLFCFLYTTCLSYMALGDLLVLVFFGIVPVCATFFLQTHHVSWQVFVSSVACGLVVDTLLLVNNFRDRDTDRAAGKLTLVVLTGPRVALWLYLLWGVMACLMGAVFLPGRVAAFLLPLLYLLLHVRAWRKMKTMWQGRQLNSCLGVTARNIFVYGLLVSIGMML